MESHLANFLSYFEKSEASAIAVETWSLNVNEILLHVVVPFNFFIFINSSYTASYSETYYSNSVNSLSMNFSKHNYHNNLIIIRN